jgi:hypothetical protein
MCLENLEITHQQAFLSMLAKFLRLYIKALQKLSRLCGTRFADFASEVYGIGMVRNNGHKIQASEDLIDLTIVAGLCCKGEQVVKAAELGFEFCIQ